MSEWKPKRFWKAADIVADGDRWHVTLDGRQVKTPLKQTLHLPTRAMADAVAEEWQAQQDVVRPDTMPVTRSANAALDKVVPQRAEVAAMLAEYGATDLLCYRAGTPEELAQRQTAAWDPLLQWAEATFGARLQPTVGIVPIAQPDAAIARLSDQVEALRPYSLTAMHDLVSLSGSLVLGLAAMHDLRPVEEIWHLSRIDEDWQIEQWGHDAEAAALSARKFQAFQHAYRFLKLSQTH